MSGTAKGVLLMVDDDRDDQYLVKMALDSLNQDIELKCMNNGKELNEYLNEVVKKGKDEGPDIILLDLNMPEMDGIQTLQAVKNSIELRHIPIIVFTTSRSRLDVRDSYKQGANAYMVKPLDFSELVEKLQSLIDYWFGTVSLIEHSKN